MKIQIQAALMLLVAAPGIAFAQTPVDEDGVVLGAYEPAYGVKPEVEPLGNEDIPLLSESELEELVGPIALYPDDLLAIVLPAAAYPLQIVEAGRFLEALEDDPSLKPDPEWDDAVVALLNYPEIVELLNDDIDWTWRLGEAVVGQQADVVTAIESFRDRAYAAGNLKSDEYQDVTRNEGAIEITPVNDDVIYVPYYEPERVVVYQPRRVYYYYPRAYPVYYYPYSSAYHFDRGYFWGVTTAFSIGWFSDSLHVYHHSYHGHPYYGHHYWDRWWYRRPSIQIYNTTYVRRPNVTINRYYHGDRWQPRHDRRDFYRDRVTRNRHTPPQRDARESRGVPVRREEPIRFRERPERQQPAVARRENREAGIAQRENRRDYTTRQQQRQPDRQARQERREAAVRDQRRQPERQARQEYRQSERQARQPERQPERQARQTYRQSEREARQTQRQPERQARQTYRQSEREMRQTQRQPERQARQTYRQPERQVRQQRRQTESRAPAQRSEPQRQARSERRESRSESRSSGNRGKSSTRSQQRRRN
ncbi:MAG: DUF3300 domain-containing protein [Woeseiaceae bacterium]|nr:DUF3300 domain-containing protein [Woeseiaceae bacterium]